jgi:hypothetical protein
MRPPRDIAGEYMAELTRGIDGQVQRGPDILIRADGLVGSPDEAAAEE